MLTIARKQFTWWQESDIRFCPVSHLVALAVADNAFEGDLTIAQIFNARVPAGQAQLNFHWKPIASKMMVFRMQSKANKTQELTASAVRYRMTSLAMQMGFQRNVSPYWLRRNLATLLNCEYTGAKAFVHH